jgi:glycosyltransferase involved in cell wall biosynthesis
MKTDPRVAFITDALPAVGGGEKVLFSALEIFAQAQIFTLIFNHEAFRHTPIQDRRIITSPLQHLPFATSHHRALLPLMPAAIRGFDLNEYDIVVSFSYAVAHGVQVPRNTRHVAYTYTPMRYAWRDLNLAGAPQENRPFIEPIMKSFRMWDVAAASRVHAFATISHAIQKRIKSAFNREARIIYPPVEIERFSPSARRENYYVALSRLVAHKRLDLVVEAFSTTKHPLVVIGEGPELKRLQARAHPNITFTGHQPDHVVAELLNKARGLVCATEEDFGIANVEAQAAGCPVLAYAAGGALETVLEDKTGIFFHDQTVESLIDGWQRFENCHNAFECEDLVQNARRFSKERFKNEFAAFVTGV